jgi:hypothetical protein
LLAENDGLLSRHLTRAIDDVCPAVAQMAEAVELAPVVAAHVTPSFAGTVMAKPAVQLDVHAELGNENVEVLRAITTTSDLPFACRQTMASSKCGVTEL